MIAWGIATPSRRLGTLVPNTQAWPKKGTSGQERPNVRSTIPAIRGTVLVRQSGWQVPMSIEGKATLGELFGDLRDGLAGITASGTIEGYVDVVTPRL
jgi:hypothetical protein